MNSPESVAPNSQPTEPSIPSPEDDPENRYELDKRSHLIDLQHDLETYLYSIAGSGSVAFKNRREIEKCLRSVDKIRDLGEYDKARMLKNIIGKFDGRFRKVDDWDDWNQTEAELIAVYDIFEEQFDNLSFYLKNDPEFKGNSIADYLVGSWNKWGGNKALPALMHLTKNLYDWEVNVMKKPKKTA